MTDRITGAEALVRCLEAEGVDTVFGYPGGVALPIFDALYDSKQIRTILPRHEQGAMHMGDGYARATGRVAPVDRDERARARPTRSRASRTRTWTRSRWSCSPRRCPRRCWGPTRSRSPTSPASRCRSPSTTTCSRTPPSCPRSSKRRSTSPPPDVPGPVLIDVPVDVSKGELDFEYPAHVNLPGYKPTFKGHSKQIKQAVSLISSARKPLLYVGGGVIAAGARKELKDLAELMQIPVVTTMMGKGSFPEDHHLWIGMPGMHGAKYTNYAITETDLLIGGGRALRRSRDRQALGVREQGQDHPHRRGPGRDRQEQGGRRADRGRCEERARGLVAELRKTGAEPRTEAWVNLVDEWRKQFPLHYAPEGDALHPQYVVERVSALTADRETIVCTEVGQNQMWACQYYTLRSPRTWVSSGGLGTMGFGFPAAIGAKAGRPDALVLDIAGDGSFQMNLQELATVEHQRPCRQGHHPQQRLPGHGAPVAGAVLRQALRLERAAPGLPRLREAGRGLRLSRAFGSPSPRRSTPRSRPRSTTTGTAIVDCRVVGEECVYPMVAPGGSIDEMLGGVPGCPVSEMLDDDLLEEVWE